MRTIIGSAVYVHEHPWLPVDRIFSPTKATEDPRLFDGHVLRPEVRSFVLEEIGRDWDGPYPDWPEWATAYLAGGEASRWWGSHAAHGEGHGEADDFDVLVGVDFERLKDAHLEFDGMTPEQIAPVLTQRFRDGLDRRLEDTSIPGVDGRYGVTAYVNSGARNLVDIKPYAAYDISDDSWAVHPHETPSDWSAASLPEYLWEALEGLLHYVDAIRSMPEPLRTREGAHLFDDLHSDRSSAFGPDGEGVFDPANVIWKSLDLHPSQPLEFLVDCKRRAEGKTATVKHVRREDSPEPEGIMIALVPPRNIVEDLVVEGGETPDNLHVTLAYLGHTTEYRRQHLADIVEVTRAWAETQHPLECRTQGAGTFVNPGSHVLWAAVDVQGIHRVHAQLIDYLRVHGYRPHEDHGFQAHITLNYQKHHVRFLPKITPASWIAREVWVVVGGRWESVPLGLEH